MLSRLKVIWIKIRLWGIVGIVNYLRSWLSRRRVQSRLVHSIKSDLIPTRGITLIGRFANGGSASKVLRDFAAALKAAEIPYQTFDTDTYQEIASADLGGILTPPEDFHFNRFTHVVEIYPTILPASLHCRHARIAFWEFESGFLLAYPDMPLEHDVIAMSEFNADYFRRVLPQKTRVSHIQYPFHFSPPQIPSRAEIRSRYGIPETAFMVFFNFDFGGAFNRKNPDGAVRAFAKAVPDVPEARLVFKTKSAKANPENYAKLQAIIHEQNVQDRVVLINDFLPEADIYGLTNACDVYLSLHRGEGFGITLAEAMSMAKPVICTDWSSTREFCKRDCTIPIPCKMAPVRPDQVDHPYYREVEEWAEPDIDAAADALRRLYEDPQLRADLGQKAANSIREQFSVENFRRSVETFLDGPI